MDCAKHKTKCEEGRTYLKVCNVRRLGSTSFNCTADSCPNVPYYIIVNNRNIFVQTLSFSIPHVMCEILVTTIVVLVISHYQMFWIYEGVNLAAKIWWSHSFLFNLPPLFGRQLDVEFTLQSRRTVNDGQSVSWRVIAGHKFYRTEIVKLQWPCNRQTFSLHVLPRR